MKIKNRFLWLVKYYLDSPDGGVERDFNLSTKTGSAAVAQRQAHNIIIKEYTGEWPIRDFSVEYIGDVKTVKGADV